MNVLLRVSVQLLWTADLLPEEHSKARFFDVSCCIMFNNSVLGAQASSILVCIAQVMLILMIIDLCEITVTFDLTLAFLQVGLFIGSYFSLLYLVPVLELGMNT